MSYQNELCLYRYISLELKNIYFNYLLKDKYIPSPKTYFNLDFTTQAIWKITGKYFCD